MRRGDEGSSQFPVVSSQLMEDLTPGRQEQGAELALGRTDGGVCPYAGSGTTKDFAEG